MHAVLPSTAGPALLRYAGTAETPIGGGAELQIDSALFGRFVLCPGCELRVLADRPKGRPIRVRPGQVFHLPAGMRFKVRSESSIGGTLLFLSYEGETGKPADEARGEVAVFRFPQIKNWISEFREAKGELSLADYYQAQSRLYAIAAAYAASSAAAGPEETDDFGFVEQARRIIRDSYDSPLDMEELARISGVGSSRFYKTFKSITGLSPLKYLTMTRLTASLRLLADPKVGVAEAAHSVGYPDEYYFSRVFKKQLGITPTEYALRAQVSVAVLCPIFTGDLAVLGISPCVTLGKDWDLDEGNRERYLREIKQAKPDLILSGPLDEALVREIRAIAPITVYDWHARPWQRRLADFSSLLGLESVAERWLADYASKTDNARRHVAERWPETPYLIVGVRRGNYRIYGKLRRKFTDLLYDELGFKAPAASAGIGFMDTPSLDDVIALGSENALFLIEFEAEEAFCEAIEIRWKDVAGETGAGRRCIFIRLDEPFLYNAAMHERLVDEIVGYIYSGGKAK